MTLTYPYPYITPIPPALINQVFTTRYSLTRYSGLVRFPRDELTCPMEVAMWSTSDLITNLTFFDDPNSTTPTKAFVNDTVDPDSTRK